LAVLPGLYTITSAEGTKQLEPAGAPINSVCNIVFSKNKAEYRIPFALVDCKVEYRLNITIRDYTTEKIYLGFGNVINYLWSSRVYQDVKFQIKGPDNIPVAGYGLQSLPQSGKAGFINTRDEVDAGPDIMSNNPDGYTPLEISPGMNGDYIIEFQIPDAASNDSAHNEMRVLKYFDASVAKGSTIIPGRLWSKAWQLATRSVDSKIKASYALFYIYTSDSIVTRFDCNGLAGGVWTIYSNQWGCSTTGTWSDRRQSISGNSTVFPQYKIFLNDPDSLVYPSGHIGEMIDFKILKEECDTVLTFATQVSKGGNIEIVLDAPPLNPGTIESEDVQLGYNVTAGYNVLLPAWDGKNAFGVPIGNGTEVHARVSFLNGLSNVPLYDVEDNPKGFKVDIQRPKPASGTSKLKLFWDDTQLPSRLSPSVNVTDGCLYSGFEPYSGCHEWARTVVNTDPLTSRSLGDTNTINTWWYLTTDQVLDVPITLKIRPSSGSISGTQNICDGQEVSFRTRAISYARKYIWHLSGPGVEIDFERDSPDTVLTYKLPISWSQGNYKVSVFGRNPQCYDGEKVSYPFIVHNPPEAGFIYTNPCQGAGITFTDRSVPADAPLVKYTWNKLSESGDKLTFQGNPVVMVFDDASNYTVNLIVKDAYGCFDTTSSMIKIKPKPQSSFEYIENPDRNGELHFSNQSTGASEYSWNFDNGTSSFLFEPQITYDKEGSYDIMLTVINPEGCMDTSVRNYYFMPGLWMPNAFTPDNNGNNDTFKPVTQRTTLEPYEFLVFDRWGQLIFKTTTPEVGWDGKHNGEPCQAGSYTYLVQYREGKIESSEIVTKRGMVSLIR
jgi:gliding motility-associated-like protein